MFCHAVFFFFQVDGEGCYLFNCLSPSVCSFSSNEKFSSYDLSRGSSNSRMSTLKPVVNIKTSMAVLKGTVFEWLFIFENYKSSYDQVVDYVIFAPQ